MSLAPGKRLLLFLSSLIVMLVIVEGGLRAFFAFRVGPSVLLYGTSYQRR